jgi:hypothetical protein
MCRIGTKPPSSNPWQPALSDHADELAEQGFTCPFCADDQPDVKPEGFASRPKAVHRADRSVGLCGSKLRIWGSGVRISSGAPQLTEGTKQTAAFKAAMQNGKICMAFAWQIQT